MLKSKSYPVNNVYLLLGSNEGDRKKKLRQAINLINIHIGTVVKLSSVYETVAWGNTEQMDFLNQAVLVKTTLNPNKLMIQIIKIEEKMGRIRKEKWGPRIIDIDILLFNKSIIENENLIIPHPHLHSRKFSLIPLLELNEKLVHPKLKKTIKQLNMDCLDTLNVKVAN